MKAVAVLLACVLVPFLALAQEKADLNTITSVRVNGGTVEIVGTKKPNFTTFTMTDPPRLVIDISEAVFAGVPEELSVGNGTVTGIRTASYGSDQNAIARVLIGYDRDVETDIAASGNQLVVKVLGGNTAVAQATPPAPANNAGAGAPAEGNTASTEAGTNAGQAAVAARDDRKAQEKASAEASAVASADRKAQEKAAAEAAAAAASDRKAQEKAAAEAAAAARASAEEEKKRQAESARVAAENQKQAEAQAARAAAEEKKRQEEDARAAAAAEKKRQQEEARAAADAKKKAEEDARAAAAAEKKRQQEEARAAAESKKQAEEDARAEKKRQQEEARAEAEAKKQAKEEARARAAAEEKLQRDAARADAEAKKQATDSARALAAAEKKRQREAARAQAEDERQSSTVARAEPPTRAEPRTESSGGGEVSSRRKTMTLVGFQQQASASRIFVRTNEPVRYTVSEGARQVVLELDNTRIDRSNNTHALDTSFFDTAVARVDPEASGHQVRVVIQLKERVPFQTHQDGNTISLDFQRPARQ